MKNYFEKSRLHKISTWKSGLTEQVREAMLGSRFKASTENSKNRSIMQVSMFGRPEAKGKLRVVTHAKKGVVDDKSSSTAEIASCSYEARERGIKSGMCLGTANSLVGKEKLIVLPYELDKYVVASQAMYKILMERSDYVQVANELAN
jgi:DNA repair protein REV1